MTSYIISLSSVFSPWQCKFGPATCVCRHWGAGLTLGNSFFFCFFLISSSVYAYVQRIIMKRQKFPLRISWRLHWKIKTCKLKRFIWHKNNNENKVPCCMCYDFLWSSAKQKVFTHALVLGVETEVAFYSLIRRLNPLWNIYGLSIVHPLCG